MPTYLHVLILTADAAALAAVAWALAWAQARLPRDDGSARSLALLMPLAVTLWLFVALTLAAAGVFAAAPDGPLPPIITYGILAPIVLLGPVVMFSAAFGRLLDALPQSIIVGFQAYRMLGLLFLFAHAEGLVPAVFAYPAGLGDILVGLTAVTVALALRRGSRHGTAYVVGWNALGIGDLVLAVSLGFFSSPGRLQLLALDAPNVAIGLYPLVMVPVFAVPLSILLHFASLRKLARERASARLVVAAPQV